MCVKAKVVRDGSVKVAGGISKRDVIADSTSIAKITRGSLTGLVRLWCVATSVRSTFQCLKKVR